MLKVFRLNSRQKLKLLKLLSRYFHKVKAGALQLVVFVTVVIALLLTSFILYVHMNKVYELDTEYTIEAIKVTDAGYEWLVNYDMVYGDTIFKQVSNSESFKAVKKHWGLFDLTHVEGKSHSKVFKKVALMGGSTPLSDQLALKLSNSRNPLVVVGNTHLKGELYMSSYGIKPGNISGLYYQNQTLYEGNLNTSDIRLSIQDEKNEYLKSISLVYDSRDHQFITDISKPVTNSFTNTAQVYYSQNEIDLSGRSICGHVVIQSEQSILVDGSSSLEDVMLIAPEIIIKQGFKGTLQCFSSQLISVDKNVLLKYPSTLFINPNQSNLSEKDPKLVVNSGSEIQGNLIYLKNDKIQDQYDSNIYIGSNSIISGIVYSEQNVELYGNVNGSVVADRFITKYESSVYLNHLLNVKITAENISKYNSGIPFSISEKSVSKWLY